MSAGSGPEHLRLLAGPFASSAAGGQTLARGLVGWGGLVPYFTNSNTIPRRGSSPWRRGSRASDGVSRRTIGPPPRSSLMAR